MVHKCLTEEWTLHRTGKLELWIQYWEVGKCDVAEIVWGTVHPEGMTEERVGKKNRDPQEIGKQSLLSRNKMFLLLKLKGKKWLPNL